MGRQLVAQACNNPFKTQSIPAVTRAAEELWIIFSRADFPCVLIDKTVLYRTFHPVM